MPRLARRETVSPQERQILHINQSCVRQAFLCGNDAASGRCFEHRREWIRERLEFLASVFGIDCLTYTILSNHLHLVLRSRPDVVAQWSDEQVARRWLRLYPHRREPDGSPCEPTPPEIDMIVNNPEVLAERRERLSDVSWWMRCTSENIARRANAEDGCRGRFWGGRFGCQLLLDEASLLACSMYVDLNPIRAAMCEKPEESLFTGVKDRIDDLAERKQTTRSGTHDWERSRSRKRSGWLSPIEIREATDALGADLDASGRRASKQGFLPISLVRYLELLDWTGRQLRSDKRGSIPSHLAPILARLGLDEVAWCDLVSRFRKIFKRAAGTRESLATEAARRGQSCLHAPGNPLASVA